VKAHLIVLAVVPLLAALTAWTAYDQPTTATPPHVRYPLPALTDRGGGHPDRELPNQPGAGGQQGDPDSSGGLSADVDGDRIIVRVRNVPCGYASPICFMNVVRS
jgi:hypothetical protein